MRLIALLSIASLVCFARCSSTPPTSAAIGTVVSFDLHADLTQPSSFWDFPYPSDLRLTPAGAPDVRGFPNDLSLALVKGTAELVGQRAGFPMLPVSYFKFSAPVAARHFTDVVAADKAQPLMLINVDEKSSERGKLVPVVAETPGADRYVAENMLTLSPRPGFVLLPKTSYAFVVMRSLGDATGKPLDVAPALGGLSEAAAPAADPELHAWKVYQPLWTTLRQIGVESAQVAAATVFTTGDPVADTADLSTKLSAKYSIQITGLQVRADGNQPRNCELVGKVSYPQFQKGTPLFDTGGLFEMGSDGLPIKQRDEEAPIAISIPQTVMPAGGFPLIVYFHGSGGRSTAVLDAGPLQSATDEVGIPHQGPAYVMAPHGFAMAGSALPVNPERVLGAPELAYLNFNNLPAFRDVFRQGIVEQRMFIDALSKLTVDPSVVATCKGVTLPQGATSIKLDLTRLAAQGQSMGGMYTNLLGAVEPRIKAAVPTGAGGLWSYMVLTTQVIPQVAGKIALLIGTTQPLTFMHPVLQMLETAWEAVEPLVYMPRLARRPLSGHPVRPVYEAVGKNDQYFSTEIYDAASLAYGHKQAGDEVWPAMQKALALDGKSGLLPYPIALDLKADDGTPYTGAIVQYNGDGVADPHAIYRQLDAVKYQYGCFHATFLKSGKATIPAPAALGTPCPGL
jgi:hypothetical protein